MTLTSPVLPADLKTAFPRDVRGMEDNEMDELLRIEETALRAQYRVSTVSPESDELMRDAMLAAWPAFIIQVRQVATEDANAEGYSVTYNRSGVIDFTFPSFIGAILAPIADLERPSDQLRSRTVKHTFDY